MPDRVGEPRCVPPEGRTGRSAETRLSLVVLAVVLVAGGVLRVLLVTGDHSVYWPDEVYKSLEPAHRAVFGYGFRAWEFVRGASNWTFSGILAGVLGGLGMIGVDDPARYLLAVRSLMASSTLVAAWATMHLARRSGASPLASVVGAALVALPAPIVYFSHRALSETASLLPVAAGLALALPAGAGRRATLAGTSLLGFAVLLRIQNVLFCATLLLVVAWRRDWGAFRAVLVTSAVWAALYGVIDWITWGSPFHAAVEYLRFTFFEGGPSRFGTSPLGYYAGLLHRAAGPLVLVLVVLAVVAARRAPALLGVCAVFVVAHSLVPHKEARFILPVVPPLAALIAVGVDTVAALARRRALVLVPLVGLLATAAAVSGAGIRDVDYGDVGQAQLFAADASAYEHGDSINRLLLAAHDRDDLCGLKIENEDMVFTGGYAYLHRDVPLYDRLGPQRQSRIFNYAIGLWDPLDPGVVALDGGMALTRLSRELCVDPPAFENRLSPNGL